MIVEGEIDALPHPQPRGPLDLRDAAPGAVKAPSSRITGTSKSRRP